MAKVKARIRHHLRKKVIVIKPIRTTRQQLKKDIQEYESGYDEDMEMESWMIGGKITSSSHTTTKVNANPIGMANIQMREAHSLLIDGDKHDWDLNNHECVVNFIVATYGKINGYKKTCGTHKKCWELFKDVLDGKTHGLSSNNIIEYFSKRFKVPTYALDQDNGVFLTYCPENADRNAPSLVFRVLNNLTLILLWIQKQSNLLL